MDAATLALTPSSLVAAAGFQAEKKQAIQKIRYSHDAMIDMIVANPWISQGELALNFGYTEGWVSQVIASDAFQARLAERKDALVDPYLRATIEERFRGLIARSLEILMRKLEQPVKEISDELALKALDIASKAAGYGSKGASVNVQANFVVAVPGKAPSTQAWAERYGAGGQAVVSSTASKAAQTVEDAVLVAPCPAAPNNKLEGAALLAELKGTGG